jgi:hypothetical protein
VSEALVSQVDFAASLATLTGQGLAPTDVPDSQNVLPALLGQSTTGRASLVQYDQRRERALRAGHWKFIPPGAASDGLGPWRNVKIPAPGLLFDLAKDPGETNNLAGAFPDKVAAMAAELAAITTKPTVRPATSNRPVAGEE